MKRRAGFWTGDRIRVLAKCQQGFSLMETLIALVILGSVGVALLSALAISARSTLINDGLSKAESLARDQIEYIQSQPYSTSNSYSVLDIPLNYPGFSYVLPMVTPLASGLQKITVTVNIRDGQSLTLEDYKVSR